jgi:hypothetical protein
MLRRRFVQAAALIAAAPALKARAGLPDAALVELRKSPLVYLSPLRSNGAESRCHSEIWFQEHEGAVYLVTSADAWRARAVQSGLTQARIWVGDFGEWKPGNDTFRAAPTFDATGSAVTDAATQDAVLERMGEKYRASWLVWGPRFRNGLKERTRVMLKYVANG